MDLLLLLCIVLVIIVIFLSVKIIFMKRTVRKISDQLVEKMNDDTNTLITVSSYDKTLRALASDINIQLSELRKQKHRFIQGDMELKNAMTNISHDLRTPLTAISGYLELLDKAEKSDAVANYTDIIKNRIEALIKLTDELFDYLVVSSPEYDFKEEPVDVKAVLEECIIGFHAALQDKGITPVINLPDEKMIRSADQGALSRVFSNIISNAIKYSDGDLTIEMTDNGTIIFSNASSGLSEVQVERLFDRFYTVEIAGKSTGLGLSIARALIEQMHGAISAQYIDGKLSIYITLPF